MTTMQPYNVGYKDKNGNVKYVIYNTVNPVETWNTKHKCLKLPVIEKWFLKLSEIFTIQNLNKPDKKTFKLSSQGKNGGQKEMIIKTYLNLKDREFSHSGLTNFIEGLPTRYKDDCDKILEFIDVKINYCQLSIKIEEVVCNDKPNIVDTIVVPEEGKTQYLFRLDGQEKVFGTHYPILKLLTGFENDSVIEWKGSPTHIYEVIFKHDELQENKDTRFMEFMRSTFKNYNEIRVSIYGKTFKRQTLMDQCKEAFKKEQEIHNKILKLENDIYKYQNDIEKFENEIGDLWKGDVASFRTLYNSCMKGNLDLYFYAYNPSRNILEEVKNALEDFLNVSLDSKQIETVKSSIAKIQKRLDKN